MRLPALACGAFLLAACAIQSGPARPGYDRDMGQYPEATEARPAGYEETGIISFYADKFHGRKTASGARFDKNAFTAAHRTLPFGTKLEVTNVATGASVLVEVNDRGPFSRNRILDVSQAAARKLGMIGRGTIEAKVAVR